MARFRNKETGEVVEMTAMLGESDLMQSIFTSTIDYERLEDDPDGAIAELTSTEIWYWSRWAEREQAMHDKLDTLDPDFRKDCINSYLEWMDEYGFDKAQDMMLQYLDLWDGTPL